MQNPGVAVKAKQVGVVAKAKVREPEQAVRGRARARAAGLKRCTMAMHLIPNPLRGQAQVDQSGALRKAANPSIGVRKSPELRAKASDLTKELV